MAKAKSDAVLLKGEPNVIQREAAGTILPGHLLTLGSGDTVVVHAGVAGAQQRLFALDQPFMGDDLDHAYLTGEAVQIHMARPGDVVNAILADGQNAAIGDHLWSGAGGELVVATILATSLLTAVVGVVLEAVDMSGSAGVDPSNRIRVLIY